MADNLAPSHDHIKAQVLRDENIIAEWNLDCKGDLPLLVNNLKEIKESVNAFLTNLIEDKSSENKNTKSCDKVSLEFVGDGDVDANEEEEEEEEEVNILSEMIKEVKNKYTKSSRKAQTNDVSKNNRMQSSKRRKK